MMNNIEANLQALISYCENSGFKGWDPYDGLNSRLFKLTPFHKWELTRLIWIQLFKRNPINLRNLVGIAKGYNPKGLGLFLTAYCNLYKCNPEPEFLSKINFLGEKLIESQSNGYSGACWGYNFDWQSKAFFLPIHTPTVVATSFVVDSLLNAYEIINDKRYLKTAESSADFVLKDLNRINKPEGFMFSYSPLDNRAVYNASLLGSRILSRIYHYTKNEEYKKYAYTTALAVIKTQHKNGSFPHSDQIGDKWRDSFHTGFKLECLSEYQRYCNDNTFSNNIENGFKYWIENFFLKNGTPKYFDNSTYPIDIHCPSQFFPTMFKLNKFDEYPGLSKNVLNWMISNMQDKEKGYFYYQINRRSKNKIPYMRWGQAWAMYGLSYWWLHQNLNNNG